MARSFANSSRPPHGLGLESLQRRTLIDENGLYKKGIHIDRFILSGIGQSGLNHLGDKFGACLGSMGEKVQGLLYPLSADEIGVQTHLAR